jgi:hypothetical protein
MRTTLNRTGRPRVNAWTRVKTTRAPSRAAPHVAQCSPTGKVEAGAEQRARPCIVSSAAAPTCAAALRRRSSAIQLWKVLALTPKSLATWAAGLPVPLASSTARSLKCWSYFLLATTCSPFKAMPQRGGRRLPPVVVATSAKTPPSAVGTAARKSNGAVRFAQHRAWSFPA